MKAIFTFQCFFFLVVASFAQIPLPTTEGCETAIPISCGDSLRVSTESYPVAFVEDCFNTFTRKIWFSFIGDGEEYEFTYSSTIEEGVSNELIMTLLKGECDAYECISSRVSCCREYTIQTEPDQQYFIIASRSKIFASGLDPAYEFDIELSCPNSATAMPLNNAIPTMQEWGLISLSLLLLIVGVSYQSDFQLRNVQIDSQKV